MLDINKAAFELNLKPKMNINQCIALTIDWYKRYKNESVYGLCCNHINQFLNYPNEITVLEHQWFTFRLYWSILQ